MKIQEAVEVLERMSGAQKMIAKAFTTTPIDGPASKFINETVEALDLAIKILSDMPEVAPARRTDPSTSHEAAKTLNPSKAHLALLRASEFWDRFGWTTTAEDLALHTDLERTGYWKRVSELKKAGLLAEAGVMTSPTTGRKVSTYRITEKGRAVLKEATS